MNFTISSLCIKEPAHLTKYSFALGLGYVKSHNSYHGQCKTYDEVKQSLDNLEKYCLFTEYNLKLFIHKEFVHCGSLLRKIMLEGEMYHLLTQLPLTVEERNNLVVYSRSFYASVVQSWSGLHPMFADFWYLFGWFHSWFLHFSWTEHSSETIKASNPFALISLYWNRYQKDSINRMNESRLTKGTRSLSTKDKERYSEKL